MTQEEARQHLKEYLERHSHVVDSVVSIDLPIKEAIAFSEIEYFGEDNSSFKVSQWTWTRLLKIAYGV